MPRPVILFSGQWIDLPLKELAQKASAWGYQGLELSCAGDHFDVPRALTDEDYCSNKLEVLNKFDLAAQVIGNYRVGQAVCDPIDGRHRTILPDHVWGTGKPREVQERAAQEMMATARAAQQMGVEVVSGFTGSAIWSYVAGYPSASGEVVREGLRDFAKKWNPILDGFRECGVKFACEVHPGQIAFDLYSAEMALDVLEGREEFGFTFDPSHLFWQGIDPVEFLRRFPDRIYHVHMKDAVLTLNGRGSVLNSYLPHGDPRRGWDFRSPGRGGIDWEALIRTLNEIGYNGPLSVEWKDAGMDRDFGAEDACKFVKRLDFPPGARSATDKAFRDS